MFQPYFGLWTWSTKPRLEGKPAALFCGLCGPRGGGGVRAIRSSSSSSSSERVRHIAPVNVLPEQNRYRPHRTNHDNTRGLNQTVLVSLGYGLHSLR